MLRTHTCGELTAQNVEGEVTLCGWVDSYRDHGGTLFVDLRDRYGKTQVVFAPEGGSELLERSRGLRSEDVIRVTGKVALRPEGTINPKLQTGEIEIRCRSLELLNKCKTPPFVPNQGELPGEDLRLKYRFLDL
ncbi:MAG: aspartate--tRNA ligase, partial [Planctomycetales bacterium]|nr:aspartate--tRNA ligase [Planctomycetales bacterium]